MVGGQLLGRQLRADGADAVRVCTTDPVHTLLELLGEIRGPIREIDTRKPSLDKALPVFAVLLLAAGAAAAAFAYRRIARGWGRATML